MLLLINEQKKEKTFRYPAFKALNSRDNTYTKNYYFQEEISKNKIFNQKIKNLKQKFNNLKPNQLTNSEKVTFFIVIWTLLLYLITTLTQFELYYVIIFLSLIITKELTSSFTTNILKKRINIFLFVFLVFYSYIITIKIMTA